MALVFSFDRTYVNLVKLTEFFSTLSSVLEYRAAAVVEAVREKGHFTVNDSILSSRELLLLLLHNWSLVGKDLQLQEDLQALAQKNQNKELLKNTGDKNKPQALSHAYSHTQKKNEVEDDTAANVEVSELEKCREHLNSILAHWDHVFPAPASTQGEETLRPGEPGAEAVAVTCAPTRVVTKWLLRSLAGQSLLREQDVSPALRWLRNRVLPHLAATQEMLRDETPRNNLFKL
ncbi:nucleolar pre-ribosomal-associated protein 1-like [Parus major]|uniref:nucleolar pre-ribosomal-associated protein 1-like n=1 Tax=Parus major TaxID=9157 RepID=UPI00077107ED|nr:nucleolar pre-ribosomal-associated protein 1-like [Parus major]